MNTIIKLISNKKVLISIGILVFIVGLFLIFTHAPNNNSNKGGTGGDYTPAGWVVVSGIPHEAGLTSSEFVEITNKLTAIYQSKGGEYSAKYIDNSLINKGERSVYSSATFSLKITQTNESYSVSIYNDLIEGTDKITVTRL